MLVEFDRSASKVTTHYPAKGGDGVLGRMRMSTSRVLLVVLVAGALVPMVVFISSMESDTTKELKKNPTGQPPLGAAQSQEAPPSVVDPQWWRRHIKDACGRQGLLAQGQDDFDTDLFKKIIVDDKYKLVYCQIPKVATTTWRRVLLYLTGKLNISDPLTISSNDAHHKYNKYLTKLSEYTQEQIQYRLDNYFKFVIVREPYERILSAFRNKFETNTSSADYFRKTFGKKIIQLFRKNPSQSSLETARDMKFSEFVQYLIDPDRAIKMNEHWERFYKLCHPCFINYDFIGKLSSIETDSQYILDKTGASSRVHFPTRSESRYGHKGTDTYMTKYYSQLSRSSLLALHDMYRADFDIFDFEIPDMISDLMK